MSGKTQAMQGPLFLNKHIAVITVPADGGKRPPISAGVLWGVGYALSPNSLESTRRMLKTSVGGGSRLCKNQSAAYECQKMFLPAAAGRPLFRGLCASAARYHLLQRVDVTMSPDHPTAQAVAIRGDRF